MKDYYGKEIKEGDRVLAGSVYLVKRAEENFKRERAAVRKGELILAGNEELNNFPLRLVSEYLCLIEQEVRNEK